jgi:hypothetical protein
MNREYLEYVIENTIDFVVHGSDPCISLTGRTFTLRQAPAVSDHSQTEGVSTTDIVGRMLMTRNTIITTVRTETLEDTSTATPATQWLGNQSSS